MPSRLTDVWTAVLRAANRHDVLAIGASPIADAHQAIFAEWLDRGFGADMDYLARNREIRADPSSRFPWARSAIVIAVAHSPERPPAPSDAISQRIARYALGTDYHEALDEILRDIESVVREIDSTATTRRYVDTGPLSDRALAAQAGLGWIGKNAMLIHPEHGSWFLIGTLLTSLENDLPAREIADQCGACTRCVDACPTGAILDGRIVDSKRCLSWATIEHRGAMPDEVADRLEGTIFGCDICQEVCPWNEAAPPSHPALAPRTAYSARPVHALLRMSQDTFSTLFRKSAVKRAKRAGLVRNALLAIPNLPADAVAALDGEDDPGIRQAVARRARRNF